MSYEDFSRCTPSEYHAVWSAWAEMRQMDGRAAWERTRSECLCTLQPHSKRRLSARDVMSFAWDGEAERTAKNNRPKLTHEEEMERYRQARERFGLK